MTDKLLEDLNTEKDAASVDAEAFDAAKASILIEVQTRKGLLEKDPARVKLVADNQFVIIGLRLTKAVEAQKNNFDIVHSIFVRFSGIVDDYVRTCLEDVQKRFDEISDKVKVFFEILEKDTTGLDAPKMRHAYRPR